MKDPGQKSQFYRGTLKEILPAIPKVGAQFSRLTLRNAFRRRSDT